MRIRIADPADLEPLLDLNQKALPEVSSLTMQEMEKLAMQACYLQVAYVDGKVAGFLLALEKGEDYQSDNYRWFSERYENFLYIDRVIVAEGFRGQGVGQALYADVEDYAVHRGRSLTCEVNLYPPNPGSLTFHQKQGFAELGQQVTEGGKKRVSLLGKALQVPLQPLMEIQEPA